jgi:hypothetical protein
MPEATPRSTRTTARGTGGGRRREVPSPDGDEGRSAVEPGSATDDRPGVCPVAFCPIGAALSATQMLKPDVVEHLLVAGRELMLAARAVIDQRLADAPEPASRLERIEIG